MKPRASLLIFVLVGFWICASGIGLADYEVGLTHGTNKHRPEFPFEPSSQYHIFAAANEWEPFQVLIRDDEGASNVDVIVSDFLGPGDPIKGIDLYRVHYQTVYPDEISHKPPDPERAGDWPDGLVPFVDHFFGEDREGAPFDVPADYAQAVFADVFIPDGQEPGDYSATVTVTAGGRPDWTGTITLTVWDFDLPNGLSLVSNYQYSRSQVCDYHEAHGGVHDCDALSDLYFKEFARHRMSSYRWKKFNPDAVWNDGAQTFDFDWTAWDEYHAPYLNGEFYRPGYKFQSVTLVGPPEGRPETVTPEVWEREYWAGWAEHFRQEGWIENLWYYMKDEPDPDHYPALRDLAARLHNADPDLQPFVTEQYEEGLGPDIDIWCPDEPLFTDSLPWPPYPEKYAELREQGKKTWWYNCVSATIGFDYSNHMVDMESSYMRIWLWLTRRYGFTGILFWRVSYLLAYQDVWETMYSQRWLCQGDGTLMYPGTIDRIGGASDIPIASLRLKYLREAMEDYEYFHILDERGDDPWVDDVTRTVAPKSWEWEHDWDKLLDHRRMVAEKILGTLDEDPPEPPAGLDAEGGIESIELSWTAPDDTDLAGFDIWYAVYEGDRFFGGTVDADTASVAIIGLTPGSEHTLWLKAFDLNGNRSAASDEVTATPLGDTCEDEDRDGTGHNPNTVQTSEVSKDGDGDDDGPGGCGGGW